jgi:hypothetical protein
MVRLSLAFARTSSAVSCLLRFGGHAALIAAVWSLASPAPVRADPIRASSDGSTSTVVFPFTVQVTTAFGPLEILFGRSFTQGDTLSGRITFDGTSSPDTDPWTAHGAYTVPSARLQLDVPSGFALDAAHVDRFTADTFDSIRGVPDELIFTAHTCCHESGIGFLGVDVLWTDALQRALTSDKLPTDPQALDRFRRVAFGLLATEHPEKQIGLFGEAPLTPTPEPGSLVLLSAGLVAALAQRRRMSTTRPRMIAKRPT